MKRKVDASGASGSGAAQPAPLSAAARKLAEDITTFGRWPTRKATASLDERQLAERLKKQPSNIRDAIRREVLCRNDALGAPVASHVFPSDASGSGVSQPAASCEGVQRFQPAASSQLSSSGAPQPAAVSEVVQRLIDDIQTFGGPATWTISSVCHRFHQQHRKWQ